MVAMMELGVRRQIDWEIDGRGFGSLIRRRRDELGLTQTAMAERLGIDQKTYSDIETGRKRRPLAPEMVQLLSSGMGISEYDLIRAMGYLADASGPARQRTGREQLFTAMVQQADEAELGDLERTIILEAIQMARRLSNSVQNDGSA